MVIHPMEFSIVVVGQDCNPTILNPDFLRYRGIVPEDWGWEISGLPITTPPFATVSYDSGVTVSVEPNRFQVTDRRTAGDVTESRASEIARAYIRELPHVRYTAVGLNFRRLAEHDAADVFLQDRFLRPGPWSDASGPVQGLGLTLMYACDEGRVRLTLEGATVVLAERDPAERKVGVLVGANYHRDCSGYPTDGQVLRHLERVPGDASHFELLLERVLTSP